MRALTMIAPLALLTACDSGPTIEAKNASVEEVADKLADAGGSGSFVRPGKWLSEVSVEEMSIPGMPPELSAKMKERFGQSAAKGAETCLTPEDVKRPKEGFFAGANKNCRYDRFTMAGGKIDAVMQCTSGEARQTMTMTGTYGPNDYKMQMSMDASGGPGASADRGIKMKMRVDAKRIGECDANTS